MVALVLGQHCRNLVTIGQIDHLNKLVALMHLISSLCVVRTSAGEDRVVRHNLLPEKVASRVSVAA